MTHIHASPRDSGAVAWPRGFPAYTGHGGLREHDDDISIVASERPATSAAMFTRSLFAGPAVVISRAHAAGQNLRAVTSLAQNANVATGRQGEENAAEVVRRVAGILGIPEFGDVEVYPEEPEADTLDKLVGIMRQDEVDIVVTLGLGDAEATVYGCDLSADYVRVNADFTT
ncbi:bifunctional ornithine acetyltransferase/N-acetylglutamate synthase [Streptomyces echinatus]|uniref:bifunctional ornithine acetyltransferase/N-acetylglutamate synthase n=1 Tax=Streptomyces echinatus TaxID=67293 RepID=UPI00379E2868